MKLDKTKIIFLMFEKGIQTQKELAQIMGIKPNTLVQFFNSTNSRPKTIAKIAKALECEVLEIIQGE